MKLNPILRAARSVQLCCAPVILLACLASTAANAQLLHNLSIGSPKALAMAHAVTADPPGIDSIHFNPAGLSRIKGRQANLKLLIANVNIDSSFGEPILPTNFYDPAQTDPTQYSDKHVYYNFNSDCQSAYPISDANDVSQVVNAHNQCWGIDPVAGASASTGSPAIMVPFVGMIDTPILAFPMGGMAFEAPSGDWTFGSAVYVPEGIGYSRDLDGPGAFQGHKVGLSRITYFSPTVAINVTDTLSVGAGVNFSYHGLGIQTKFRAPTLTLGFLRNLNTIPGSPLPEIDLGPYDNIGLLTMEMEDLFSVGFNFGILWETTPWLTLGFSYKSEAVSDLEGDYKMENTDNFLHTAEGLSDGGLDILLVAFGGARLNATSVESGTVKTEYIVPQSVAFGASMDVLPNLKINVDLKWIEYSRWDELTFTFSQNNDFLSFGSVINTLAGLDYADPDEMRIQRKYEDTWSWAIGGEYRLNNNVVLRAGYEPRKSSIPDDRTDLLFPIGDADLYTAGIGWQFDDVTVVEAAVGYMHSKTSTPSCESRNANSCVEGDVVYNPYYSMPFENEVNAYLFAFSVDRKF